MCVFEDPVKVTEKPIVEFDPFDEDQTRSPEELKFYMDLKKSATQRRHLIFRHNEEISMDPLKLPELCVDEIMSYLNGKELLSAMLVTKKWKAYVNSKGSLMNKIVVKPSFKDFSVLDVRKILNGENKRDYKHMASPYFQTPFNTAFHPISCYASTLETLEVEDLNDSFPWKHKDMLKMEPCVFPKLQRLKFSGAVPFDYFRGSSFSALTYLHIKDDGEGYNSNTPKFIRLFPKLEILWDNGWIQGKKYDFKRKSEKFYQNQPKLKIIRAIKYIQAYMEDFSSTLQQIEIGIMDKEDVCELLQYFKSLKSMVV
jgi:hypothetical protein